MRGKPYIIENDFYTEDGEHIAYLGDDEKWKELDGSPYKAQNHKCSPPWLVGKDFASKKENIQHKGRGKTSLVSLSKKWREEENPEVTKKQMQTVYKQMLTASRREIEAVSRDRDAPLAVTVLAESLLDPKTRAKTLQDVQVWIYGREAEEIKVTTQTIKVDEEVRETILRKIGEGY